MPNKAKTPGAVLQATIADYMLSPTAVAKDIKVRSLGPILADKAEIDIDLALRLAKYFGNTPEEWINIQLAFSKKALAAELKDISKAKKPLKLKAAPTAEKVSARRGRKPAADKTADKAPARRGRKSVADKASDKAPARRRGRKPAASSPAASFDSDLD